MDANRHFLHYSSSVGFDSDYIPLGQTFGDHNIVYPSAIIVTQTNESDDLVVYTSEYFGRLWRYPIRRNVFGVVDRRFISALDISNSYTVNLSMNSLEGAPHLLLDKSRFASSLEIRNYVNAARSLGVSSYEVLFFDMIE